MGLRLTDDGLNSRNRATGLNQLKFTFYGTQKIRHSRPQF